MRRVKDVFDDFYLAGRETRCTACQTRRGKLKDELAELQEDLTQARHSCHLLRYDACAICSLSVMRPPMLLLCAQIVGQQACTEFWEGRDVVESDDDSEGEEDAETEALKALKAQISELRTRLKSFHYYSTSTNPQVNKYVFERYPGIAASFPAIITKNVAISTDVLMVISRAARTAQSSLDCEKMFHEFRCLRNATSRLAFYQLQRLAGPFHRLRPRALIPSPLCPVHPRGEAPFCCTYC